MRSVSVGFQGWWVGVLADQLIWLRQGTGNEIEVLPRHPAAIKLVSDYFQCHVDYGKILSTFPDDGPMRKAMEFARGLRILKQDHWECLASFILSSSKQVVQIQQVVELLSARLGTPIKWVFPEEVHPPDSALLPRAGFPSAEIVAASSESLLRECKMGFRAKYLLGAARMVASGEVNLEELDQLSCGEAREQLMRLPGVGEKIANCVLLFGYSKPEAFPIDVWIERALKNLYFSRKRKVNRQRIQEFSKKYFGPYGGHAQQYLFHYVRLRGFSELEAVG